MALVSPVCQIAQNAGLVPDEVLAKIKTSDDYNYGYNAGTNKYGDMLAFGILDPTRVTCSAIANAVSVAGMLLTTQCIISENKEDRNKRLERLKVLQHMAQESYKKEGED